MSIYRDVKLQFLEIVPPTTSDKGLKISGTAEITGALTLSSDLAVGGNTTITGDLTVDGTTTTVNSTVVDVVDPIMTIGANASDDNKDRGLVFKYNDGAAKLGFIGYDDSLSQFSMMTTVTNTSEVVSGTLGTLQIAGISATSSTFDLDSANAMSLNSSGGAINVGNDDIDQAINIGTQGERTISVGTGAFADTINIGNATGATAVSITSGTGGITITPSSTTTVNKARGTIAQGTSLTATSPSIPAGESGSIIHIDTTSNSVLAKLPSAVVGLNYTFVLSNVSNVNNSGIECSTNGADFTGFINDGVTIDTASTNNNTLKFTTNAVVGNWLQVTALTTGFWMVTGSCQANSSIAFSTV